MSHSIKVFSINIFTTQYLEEAWGMFYSRKHFHFEIRQCLLHRPSFQHLITAAPVAAVVLFCCSIYYLSSWHRCPNPNSNNKILEKKKEFVALWLSSAIFGKRVQRAGASIPGGLGGSRPPQRYALGVQRVKDPPIKINMSAIYHGC